jgi:sec-independent protein translocase protein TatA
MGNLGFGELLLIGVILLLFFGPSRLPELGKSLGKGIQEFKKASRELTDSVKEDITAEKK